MVAVQNQDELCLASMLQASKELEKTESKKGQIWWLG